MNKALHILPSFQSSSFYNPALLQSQTEAHPSPSMISLQSEVTTVFLQQQYTVTVAMTQINDAFISNTASQTSITVLYTQNTDHLQLSKYNTGSWETHVPAAEQLYAVLPLNMTFWDGAGTPVASVSASHKSFNSGSCPSCAVKVMLCLVVPETRTVIIAGKRWQV